VAVVAEARRPYLTDRRALLPVQRQQVWLRDTIPVAPFRLRSSRC